MQQENESFWTEIKKFEERLAKAPDSYLFARLAEVYLKVGLVDDALHIARQGVAKYPFYIAGQRALALACHAKGLQDECLQALEKATAGLPEDSELQKILGRIHVSLGNDEAAIRVFRSILDFNPDDAECQNELDVLEHKTTASPPSMDVGAGGSEGWDVTESFDRTDAASEEISEDIEIIELSEYDVIEEEHPVPPASVQPDPLSTTTLAELYVQQGFIEKALEIYRVILSQDPTNTEVVSRIADLTTKEPEIAPAVEREVQAPDTTFSGSSFAASDVPVQGRADNAVGLLEKWLDNIRRIKACR